MEREKYLRSIERLSDSGIDMVDRDGRYAGWFDQNGVTSLRDLLPSSLTVYPYPPGHRIDGI